MDSLSANEKVMDLFTRRIFDYLGIITVIIYQFSNSFQRKKACVFVYIHIYIKLIYCPDLQMHHLFLWLPGNKTNWTRKHLSLHSYSIFIGHIWSKIFRLKLKFFPKIQNIIFSIIFFNSNNYPRKNSLFCQNLLTLALYDTITKDWWWITILIKYNLLRGVNRSSKWKAQYFWPIVLYYFFL